MEEIIVDSVSVEFPIYDIRGRSIRAQVLSFGTGGRVSTDRGTVTVVALDNVSFRLSRGDRVGIIGHNGSGKTTLLRVLAGIYHPVRGTVRTRGSVAPLFDITLGMDQDSTGRENIKLRGLLMGMTRREVEQHAEDIIAFSELGSYIDMPVRTYSAGMSVRLAFAITTTQEPEILLLDEMLNAGDARFFERAQQRLDRYLSRAGIMVVASHSESMLCRMCNKALLLHHGKLEGFGPVDEILAQYASLIGQSEPADGGSRA